MSADVLFAVLMFMTGLGCGLLGAMMLASSRSADDSERIDLLHRIDTLARERRKAEDETRQLQREANAIFSELRESLDKWQPDRKEG